MKKTKAVAMALVLCMMFGEAALAETAKPTEEPVSEEYVLAKTTQAGQAESDSFLEWIGQGWNLVTDFVESGTATVSETVTSWANIVSDTLTGWYETVETYVTGNQWSEDVQNAWDTLKKGAENAGKVAQEDLENAYHTVRNWMIQEGDKVDQGVAAAVDWIASSSGVMEATVSGWYRTVEAFMTTNANRASESVKQSWETIKQANSEGLSIAKDKLEDACQTVQSWLASLNEDTTEEQIALSGIMEQMNQE